MSRRTWGPAAVALLGLLVAGCSEPEPRFAEPTESASPSASGSATPSDSAEPEALNREATVRAWVEAWNNALDDGDTSGMRALWTEDCNGCQPFEDNVSDVYTAGGYIKTPGWSVLETFPRNNGDVDIRVKTAAGTTLKNASSQPERFEANVTELRFGLTRGGSRWVIDSIAVFTG